MDKFTKAHLKIWLQKTCHRNEIQKTQNQILLFLKEYPEILDEGRSWPEIRNLAENMSIIKKEGKQYV